MPAPALLFVVALTLAGLKPTRADPSEGAADPSAPRVVVVDLQPLGVGDDTAGLASSLVVVRLRAQLSSHDIRTAGDLAPELRQQAQTCSLAACWQEVARQADVAVVVHGTLGRLGSGLVVTLDADRAALPQRTHVVEQSTDGAQLEQMINNAVQALVRELKQTPPTPPTPTWPTPSTTKPATAPRRVAANDVLLLALDYGLLFIPLVNSPAVLPLVQGLAHLEGGPELVSNEYPNWWMGTLAGYGVFAVGGAAFIGLYAYGGVLLSSSDQSGVGLLLSALGVAAVTVLAEPAVFWVVARNDARPVEEALDEQGRAAVEVGLSPASLLLGRSPSPSPSAYGLFLR